MVLRGQFVLRPDMSVSSNGHPLLYVQLDDARNNLVLAENFR
jgi:hypothetical protein